jgi:hypothetical protein
MTMTLDDASLARKVETTEADAYVDLLRVAHRGNFMPPA